jgi:tRNA threonylcarbamoyladenosine biosynthesis protein TsaB
MRALAIDTSGPVMGVAALEYESDTPVTSISIVATMESDTALRHTESLTPALDQILRRTGWPPRSLSGIFVAAGPGSFTGLRIGMAAAKGFALAASCSVVSVDSLEALAASEAMNDAPPPARLLVPVMDARKGRLYAAIFQYDEGAASEIRAPESRAGGRLVRCSENLDVEPHELARRIAEVLGTRRDGRDGRDGRDDDTEKEISPATYRATCRADAPPVSWSIVSTEDPLNLTDHLTGHLKDHLKTTLAKELILPPPADEEIVQLRSAIHGVSMVGARLCAAGVRDDPYAGPHYVRSGEIGAPRNYPRFTWQGSVTDR